MVPNFSFNTFDFIDNMKSPRLIKTHVPAVMLPDEIWIKKPKIIYVVRDPRDAAISYYHFSKSFRKSQMEKDEFLTKFVGDQIAPGPFWLHVLEFWRIRHLPNILFLTYEEMKNDLTSVIKMVAQFLDKPITQDQTVKLVDHLSFENMKKNPMISHDLEKQALSTNINSDNFQFLRRGVVGGYKDEFPKNYDEMFSKWIKKNLEGTDCDLYL